MVEALLWGLVGASSLVVGAVLGLRLRISKRTLGLLLGFGAGALISAVSFELADDALKAGSPGTFAAGLAAGALAFYLGDRAIDRLSPSGTARPRGSTGGLPLLLGAFLDGVPEQAALGLGLSGGEKVGVALLAAIFISNVPESLGSVVEMKDQRTSRDIVLLWAGVAVLLTGATVVGYLVLGDASGGAVSFVQAFAAGAILVMLTDSMIPDAVRGGHRAVGLVTTLGFAISVLLSQTSA